MLTRIRKTLRQRGIRFVPILALLIVLGTVGRAYALSATAPVKAENGDVSCPTCVFEDSVTQYGIPVWSTTQNPGVISPPDADTSKILFSAGTGANPAFRNLGIADLPDSIKTGTTNETKVVTYAAGSTTAGKQATFDSDGNLYSSTYDVGAASSVVPAIDVSPGTPLTVLSSTPVFCGLDGFCSTTANGTDVQTRFTGSGTFASLNCAPTGGTTNAITATLRSGACNAELTGGDLGFTLAATAWGAGSASGTSTGFTTGQCVVLKFTAATNADTTNVRCSLRQTAGS